MKRILAAVVALLPLTFTAWALAPATARAQTPPASGASIAAKLQPFVDSHSLAGAVALVASKDKVLSIDTVGYADVAAKKPMQVDSIFWIASMSKPITAAGLMILVDEGKVKIDDLVEKYLPEFSGQMVVAGKEGNQVVLKKPVHPITVKNVLSHTSGLAFSSPKEQPTLDGLPLCDAVRSYAALPLQFEPDSKYQYSNAGINTAARIIEVVTGQAYEKFMDERLFAPLGMRDTSFWLTPEQVERLAKSYRPDAAKTDLEEFKIGQLRYPLTDREHRFPMPAGGLFATAGDVAKFCQMVLNGGELNGRRYLSEAAVKQMVSRQTPETLKESYGLGWSTGGGSYGHGGAHATNMSIDAKRGLIFVWMVQHAGFPKDGGNSQGAFRRAAEEQFGAAKK